ncbi:MAG: hypothetical protein FD189_2502 [Elusimicrobia bacterium]|nr:MAG: hypothetical protein FD154_2450 [Elusimicrobiota bacterium]KAF0152237.1 MAG: hypothetical protein FD189_2502 [Elusimicrobiota bacterium]
MKHRQHKQENVPASPTKGELEARISDLVVRFEREYMGRGPEEIRTYLIDDMVFIRLKKVLTPAEHHLSKIKEGSRLVKQTRLHLLESGKTFLEKIVRETLGRKVISMHTDISTKTGDRVIILTTDSPVVGVQFDSRV